MATIFPDFAININHKRWPCVLDPTLALSIHGLPLLTRLGSVLEIWVARELWHILDNTHYYLQQPEILMVRGNGNKVEKAQAIMQTLLAWERIRLDNDPSRQHCYWIGDSPLESFLPDNIEPDIIYRYEALSASLDHRLPNSNEALPSACRDTATLATCLPSAFILTYLPTANTAKDKPSLCDVLESGGIVCQQVAADDSWQQEESTLLRQLLVQTGLSKWVWSGLKLAILHLVVPAACTMETPKPDDLDGFDYSLDDTEMRSAWPTIDYWREARGFWYPL